MSEQKITRQPRFHSRGFSFAPRTRNDLFLKFTHFQEATAYIMLAADGRSHVYNSNA